MDHVYVFGHSMADVDLPYFKKVKESVRPDASWSVSVREEEEIPGMESRVAEKLSLPKGKVCVKAFAEFRKSSFLRS